MTPYLVLVHDGRATFTAKIKAESAEQAERVARVCWPTCEVRGVVGR
jgi:hypothetical protein